MDNIDLQPNLQNEKVILKPLAESDFEILFEAANDPLIWEQHPNPDRYKREVFLNYFKGAMQSGGAFLIKNTLSGEVIGCSRFCNLDQNKNEIHIGYTFFKRSCWGKGFNQAVKKLMLDHIFNFVEIVIFQVGAMNRRSQIAMERLGAVKIDEEEVAYFGEPGKLNFIYEIRRTEWGR